jgi:two-component system NarL family sensor kinase
VGALEELIQDVQNSHPGLIVLFDQDVNHPENIQPLVTQMVYQITLELLNNITRYAHAQKVTIQLNQLEHLLILSVSDNGIGYDFKEASRGIGLQNINARVQVLNGLFTVSRLTKGMQHTVEIPAQTKLFL